MGAKRLHGHVPHHLAERLATRGGLDATRPRLRRAGAGSGHVPHHLVSRTAPSDGLSTKDTESKRLSEVLKEL